MQHDKYFTQNDLARDGATLWGALGSLARLEHAMADNTLEKNASLQSLGRMRRIVPSFCEMMCHVLRIGHKTQIFKAVVVLNPIDMMDKLVVFQWPTKGFCHHKSMLKNVATFPCIGMARHFDMDISTAIFMPSPLPSGILWTCPCACGTWHLINSYLIDETIRNYDTYSLYFQ